MVLVENLLKVLKKSKINFYTGVPDSILKDFSSKIESLSKKKHVIATSEGAAISLGIGYYLSTKKLPCIYLQNSGLGNAINPLISIASKEVYSIPLLLLIGWRGSPKKADEPQHKAKGKITKALLNLLKIKFCILRQEKDLIKVKKLINGATKNKNIVACLIEKETLKNNYNKINKKFSKSSIYRYDFIREFIKNVPAKCKIISTTGYTSRELMQLRKENKKNRGKDFYMVGGMGHSASVASGYALNSNKEVFCLDGDGSVLMHLGAMRTIGFLKNKNYKHVILNNNSHESVGGQPTNADGINFKKLIYSVGYKNYFKINSKNNIKITIKKFINSKGPSLLEVKIVNGSLKNLLRPKNLLSIKEKFMTN